MHDERPQMRWQSVTIIGKAKAEKKVISIGDFEQVDIAIEMGG
jgi:hypothetical protein